jgi:alkanesulfonate monooxygenase SsuD/methylene tetrahydromethanopterin reductase-like flavin-dependent oxidoreductase (luciferase family)
VARFADHWNHPGASVDDWRRTLDVLHQRCAEVDRDPATITTSIHVRADWSEPASVADECARWADAGLDLAILYLPTPHDAAVLPAVAEAIAPLAGD